MRAFRQRVEQKSESGGFLAQSSRGELLELLVRPAAQSHELELARHPYIEHAPDHVGEVGIPQVA
ncbi:hypothetical protein [Tenggerimyces flavus]|uniref:Uncharacterized protein n=1 Tax=Tenggerimyces flavus TaxID=1708749 RepID=A0ABV7YKX6_9ACTN|nr:hypothetical protein [Tenggerimyces flavus]MBM7788796.1 hypothetical protein [Tenggerimyces flavus]